MSLTWINTIDTTSTTLMGAYTDEGNNRVGLIDQTNGYLRQFSLSSLTQVASSSIGSNQVACTLINAASAVVGGNSTSNFKFVEVLTGYTTTFTSPATIINNAERYQMMAADLANSICLCISGNNRSLTRINGNTFSAATITIDGNSGDPVMCVIFKGSGRFLIGTGGGHIYEIDSTGQIFKQFVIDRNPAIGTQSGSVAAKILITSLAYQDDFLIVGTNNDPLVVIDYTTGTVIHNSPIVGSGLTANLFSNTASGSVLLCRQDDGATSTFCPVYEMSIYNYGFKSASPPLYINSPGHYTSVGINTVTGVGWAVQETIDELRVFQLTTASSVAPRTFSSPDGSDFRLILLDMTDGQGHVKRLLDTYTTSPRTLNWLPTGRDIIEIIKVGDGANAVWDASRYTS